jgi:NitT/TauT family transport system permease protein
MATTHRWWANGLTGAVLPIAALVIWEIFARLGVVNVILVGSPSRIASSAVDMATDGRLLGALGSTMLSLVIGFAISLVIGLIVGTAMGISKIADAAFNPLVILAYNAPLVAFYPLIIIIFGLSIAGIIFMAVLFATIPVVINTALAVKMVPKALIRSARAFGASRSEVLRNVVAPGALVTAFTGVRLAVGRAVVGVIVAEMFMGSSGLGYLLVSQGSILNMAGVYVAIIAIGIVGYAMVAITQRIEHRLVQRFGVD